MGTYVYSAKNNAFFPALYLNSYSRWDLSDALDVSDSVAMEFMSDDPMGKVRVAGSDGYPAWGDIPPPTHEELVYQAEMRRQSLLDEANAIMADWRTELTLGIISDGDKAKLTAWMMYIQHVKAVDTSLVPDITWPDKPE